MIDPAALQIVLSPGPVETALWLGPEGVAATVAKNSGVDFETAKQQVVASQGGFATGRFTRPDEVADQRLRPFAPKLTP